MTRPRFRSLSPWLRERFGVRVAKIALDAGLGCPNRDGTLSFDGCLFCDQLGSGTGAAGRGVGLTAQIEAALPKLRKRYKAEKFIAYFQAFSNTHGPSALLARLYEEALRFDEVIILAVGTRPDCLAEDKLELLARINRQKEVWLELGLQSALDKTLRAINRGHDFAAFASAVRVAASWGLKVWAHLILGLPGEGFEEAAETMRRISPLGLCGVKLHGLYVSADAPLAGPYGRGEVELLSLEQYVGWVARLIGLMPPQWVIQRLTSDPNPESLMGPKWMLDKPRVLKAINERLEELDVRQGAYFKP